MRFTDVFIRRPVLAATVSLLIFIVGLQALLGLQIRQYPKMINTVVTVTTRMPGASAESMQGFVTQTLQQAIAQAEGIDYMTSETRPGESRITVAVSLGYSPDAALTGVMAQVASVRSRLPRGIDDPVIERSTGASFSVAYLAFSSDRLTAPQISDYLVRVVQPKLSTVAGVANAKLLGGQDFAIRVWLDPMRMAAFDLTAEQVRQAISANNYQTSAGQVRGPQTVIDVSAATDLRTPEEFAQLFVASRERGIVRLGDVATVELGARSTDSQAFARGRPAVLVGVDPTPDANPLTVMEGIRAVLPDLRRNLPAGMELEVVYDTTVFIDRSIDEVVKTIGEATVIVIVVILLFLGSFRAVAVPVVTIPLSLVGVGIALSILGFSVNLLTLLAMVLAIGLVVDDAIVVVENVDRHIKEGRTPFEAALIGTREIAVPVISMTVTLAAVYAPIAFMGGLTGALFREFALTLAGAVFVSGVVALTLSPMMCARILRHEAEPGRFAALVDRVMGRLERAYGRALDDALAHRPVVVLFAAIVFASLIAMLLRIPSELAPAEDQGAVMVQTQGPVDASIDYMVEQTGSLDTIIAGIPETRTSLSIVGTGRVNQGLSIAVLQPWEERARTDVQVRAGVQASAAALSGLKASVFSPPPLPGSSGLPVQLVVNTTYDYRTLAEVMRPLVAKAMASGLFVYGDLDLKFSSPLLQIDIDRDKAGAYGVTMADVGTTLATMMSGGYVNQIAIDGRSYQVIPQVPQALRMTPEAIGSFYVRSASGAPVPLANLISDRIEARPVSLSQFNQLNAATFEAVMAPGVSVGTAVDALRRLAAEQLPNGFSIDFKGESRQYVQEGSALAGTFLLALVIIFLVLAAQFESFRDPVVILVTVPLSICGALVPLALGLATLNIYSQVGLVTLIGLISKHGILICEVAKEEQERHGRDRRAAVAQAARVRLRPILMTTAAMVAGLVPLLLAAGAGAASRYAIGLVLVAGLTVGTLFTLFVLPVIYTYLATTRSSPVAAGGEPDTERAKTPAHAF